MKEKVSFCLSIENVSRSGGNKPFGLQCVEISDMLYATKVNFHGSELRKNKNVLRGQEINRAEICGQALQPNIVDAGSFYSEVLTLKSGDSKCL